MKKHLNKFISANPKYNEVCLFREISRYFSKTYQCTFIEETHQHYVTFDSSIHQCSKEREISDLLIISYSIKRKKIRMTFLQAKLNKKTFNKKPFRFKGDYFQYDLLSTRPSITDKRNIFESDVLSKALYDSVSSYGIFYKEGRGNLNFAYSTASDLKTTKHAIKCSTKERTFYFPEIKSNDLLIKFNPILKNNNHLLYDRTELQATLDADIFECCLLNLIVGTPIESDYKTLISIKTLVSKKITDTIVNQFSSFIDDLLIDQDINNQITDLNFETTPQILLINIDDQKINY